MCHLISYMVWNYLDTVSQLLLNKVSDSWDGPQGPLQLDMLGFYDTVVRGRSGKVWEAVKEWAESVGRSERPGSAEAWYARMILWSQSVGWRRALGLKGWQLLVADGLWGMGGEAVGSEAGGMKHGWKTILELPLAMLTWCLNTMTHEGIRVHKKRGKMREYSMDRL